MSVNEPARAAATHLAIHVRLSVETEEAGNRVERVDPAAIVTALERNGFSVVRCERYAMVYRHEPGRAARLLLAGRCVPLCASRSMGSTRCSEGSATS